MKAFELTNKAKEDLRKIATYTQNRWGRDQRNLYIKQLDDSFHLLSKNPLAGKECAHIKKGYRKFPQGSHIVFYKEGSKGKITIIRILHQSMDIESKIASN